MVKRKKTDNKTAKQKKTDNKMVKPKKTDNKMAKRKKGQTIKQQNEIDRKLHGQAKKNRQ